MKNYISKNKLKAILEATIKNCNLIINNSDKVFNQAYYRGQKKVCEELLEEIK